MNLVRRIDPQKLGAEMQEFVQSCREAGCYVTVLEHLASGRLTILTHDKPEPRAEVVKAIEDQALLEASVEGVAQ